MDKFQGEIYHVSTSTHLVEYSQWLPRGILKDLLGGKIPCGIHVEYYHMEKHRSYVDKIHVEFNHMSATKSFHTINLVEYSTWLLRGILKDLPRGKFPRGIHVEKSHVINSHVVFSWYFSTWKNTTWFPRGNKPRGKIHVVFTWNISTWKNTTW